MHLGIDIGGTFTDLVLLDDEGRLSTSKALTTPGELEIGVLNAVSLAAEARGVRLEDLLGRVAAFGHGTTQATNALIERTGARTGLITTRGFGDTIELQRLLGFSAGVPVDRLGWYSKRAYPPPIVPRGLRREVRERVDRAGQVILPLDEAEIREAVEALSQQGADTFAVVFLWSFRNPVHERRVGEIIREMRPGAYVSLSCEVAPIIGEYERAATTAMNSYLAPKVVSYLEKVETLLEERGFRGKFYILNSSGGVMPAHEAARRPVLLVTSGPTGGVLGSLHLAKSLGESNVITTDMGGTSFDVSIIVDGKPLVSVTHEAGGFHLNTPMIDIRAVGAGGGSIARVDGGLLRVGPESAGARPGPVCYGRGGTLATVTDADVVLGIISPDNFLGGRMKLDRDAAIEAIREQIAEPLGLGVEAAAAGVRRVVDAHMADTLREVTIGRGYDPRDFVIFAYGGAGPAHCAGFAAELGVRRIIVPATSMAHSAYGALAADVLYSAERSHLLRGGGGTRDPWEGVDAGAVSDIFSALEKECLARAREGGADFDDVEIVRTVDMRYRRQTHDLIVTFERAAIDDGAIRRAIELFEAMYEGVYGQGAGFREAGVELSTFRVQAIGRTPKPPLVGSKSLAAPVSASRAIFEPALMDWRQAGVWRWLDLPIDHPVEGPAVIEHPETTVYVGAAQRAVLDTAGNLSIELGGRPQ